LDTDNETALPVRQASPRVRRYALLLALVWTFAVGVSLAWNYLHERDAARQAASVAARREFAKDVIYRRWNTGHGGVYVPVSESTPPNPYLEHVEEREIDTLSGRRLTLINPAYMTRQVHELGFEAEGVRGHITSLNPIRPANAPDAWEKRALEAFERGEREFSSVEVLDGESHLRLMRPLMTEKACLECHADQGYEEGDVRGGISVAMPMAPYVVIARGQMTVIRVGHGALWLLGLAALVFGTRQIQQRVREHDRAQKALKKSEATYQDYFDNAPDMAVSVSAETREILDCNQTAADALGYTKSDIIGRPIFDMYHPGCMEDVNKAFQSFVETGEVKDAELQLRTRDGGTIDVSLNVTAVRDEGGNIVRSRSVWRDITARREAEKALWESESFAAKVLDASLNGVYIYDLKRGANAYINRQYTRLTGYTLEDINAMTAEQFSALFHADDYPRIMDHWEKIGCAPGRGYP